MSPKVHLVIGNTTMCGLDTRLPENRRVVRGPDRRFVTCGGCRCAIDAQNREGLICAA